MNYSSVISGYETAPKLSETKLGDVTVNSGFDVVIGNPPYVSITGIELNMRRFFKSKYKTAVGRFDLFGLFIEKSVSLIKEGYLSFIIPNKFLTNNQSQKLRNMLLNNGNIKSILHSSDKVFVDASVNSIVFVFKREKNDDLNCNIVKVKNSLIEKENEISNSIFRSDKKNMFIISLNLNQLKIRKKIEENKIKLEDIAEVRDGIVAGRIKDILFHKEKINETCKPLLFGVDINRYKKEFSNNYVDYREDEMKKQERIRVGEKGLGLRLRFAELYERPKILTRKVGDKIIAAFDDENYYYEQTIHSTHITNSDYNPHFILAILNSSLIKFYYQKIISQSGTIFPQIRISFLKNIPIPKIDFSIKKQKQTHDTLIVLVDQMLETQKLYHAAKLERDKKLYKQKIDIIDNKIDKLVYELYGLSDEEIEIVEECL